MNCCNSIASEMSSGVKVVTQPSSFAAELPTCDIVQTVGESFKVSDSRHRLQANEGGN